MVIIFTSRLSVCAASLTVNHCCGITYCKDMWYCLLRRGLCDCAFTSADAQIQDIYELRISARMARFSEPESFRWRRGGPFFAPVSISRAICCDPHHSRRLARQAARICAAAWRSHDAFRIRDTLFCRVTCDTCVERCVTRTCVCPQRVQQIACVFSITNRHTHTHESSHTHHKSSHTQQLVGVYVTT